MTTHAAIRESRSAHNLARVLLTLIAAVTLLESATLDASASTRPVRFEAGWQDTGTVLANFEAVWQNSSTILVVWETEKEDNAIAFFLYRAESESGPWDDYYDFEPAAGDEATGAQYSFTDDEVTEGVTYWYRLEELDYDGASTFYGPIRASQGGISATSTPTTSGTRSATSTPTKTKTPGQDVAPTATRMYTNTPQPSGTGTPLPTQTQPPQPTGAVRATPAPPGSLQVTTPTPIGGIPPAPPATPIPEVTATPEGAQIQPTDTPTAVETPTSQPPQQTPPASPTAQGPSAGPKETSQPLLDASAAQVTPLPPSEAPRNNAPSSRLVLLLGAGTLAAAVILGALALIIWRRSAR